MYSEYYINSIAVKTKHLGCLSQTIIIIKELVLLKWKKIVLKNLIILEL